MSEWNLRFSWGEYEDRNYVVIHTYIQKRLEGMDDQTMQATGHQLENMMILVQYHIWVVLKSLFKINLKFEILCIQ